MTIWIANIVAIMITMVIIFAGIHKRKSRNQNSDRLNILFIVSDDEGSFHTSDYRAKIIKKPTFDWIAEVGLLVTNYFASATQCSSSGAAILVSQHIRQNGPLRGHIGASSWRDSKRSQTFYMVTVIKQVVLKIGLGE